MENELDEFLGNLKGQKENDPFEKDSTDPFVEDKTKDSDTEEDSKPLPFNKDPKVQKFIEKEIKKRLEGLNLSNSETQKFVKETKEEGEDEGIELLTRIIGNDTPEKVKAVKDFRKFLSNLEEKASQRTIKELEAKTVAEREEEAKAENELNEGFENIEENFGVDITSNTSQAKKTRNEFIDFIKKIAPKDADGQVSEFPDLNSAFELFQERSKTSTTSRAKQLANRSIGRSGDASTVTQTTGKSWKDVDRIFSKLP